MNIENNKVWFWVMLICLLVPYWNSLAQTTVLEGKIVGKIIDKDSEIPLEGASIVLENSESSKGTVSDSIGYFQLENIPLGRQSILVQYLGYQSVLLTEILVTTAKEVVVDIAMEAQINDLTPLEVYATQNFSSLENPSTRSISVEQTKRFAAAFFDPARVTYAYPGVVNTNDQGNQISVRGNSPDANMWRLQGVEIVNPNHTSNAGTLTDQPTATGGGVNMLSAQMLGKSTFLSGGFGAEYGNALGGIFDMNLRSGNNNQHEFTTQIGLLGIDLAAEGPLTKAKNSSFLVNYRYSTIGLLSTLGVPLGDEDIRFQDLAFNLTLPTEINGTFSIFGMAGKSSNILEAERNAIGWEFAKDRSDIRYQSEVGIVGIHHQVSLAKNTIWETTMALSTSRQSRAHDTLDDDFFVVPFTRDTLVQTKFSLHSKIVSRLHPRHKLEGGLFLNRFVDESQSIKFTANLFGKYEQTQLRPYLTWAYDLAPQWLVQVGAHGLIGVGVAEAVNYSFETPFGFNWRDTPFFIEPRIALNWSSKENRQFINLSYSLQSQQTASNIRLIHTGSDLLHSKSHHIVLQHGYQLQPTQRLTTALYYQNLFDIPITNSTEDVFSAINYADVRAIDLASFALVNEGTGTNYGIETSLEQLLQNDYYYVFSGTVYKATYTTFGNVDRGSTKYDGRFALALTGGKEWDRSKKGKNKNFSINTSFNYLGGLREAPINEERSAQTFETVYQQTGLYTTQLPNYYRLNLRFAWQRNKAKYTRTVSLDIQNASNRTNVAYNFYDWEKNEIITQNQLGIIPVVNWRLEW